MKKPLILMIFLLVGLAGCSTEQSQELTANFNDLKANLEQKTISVDSDKDGTNDIQIKKKEEYTEVTLDLPDMKIDKEEAIDFCKKGGVYNIDSENGEIVSEIIGKENYKGKEWCKAQATVSIDTPVGQISNDIVYYFDETNKEFWIKTTMSGGPLQRPKVNEVHLKNGAVINE